MNLAWLIKAESYKRGMFLSVAFNGIAKAILFLLTILIAKFFGSNTSTDIYFFIYATMMLLSGFINAVDTTVLIPESMRIRETLGNAKAAAFLNYFFRIYFFVGLVFVAGVWFFGTTIFSRVSKFTESDIRQYENYFWLGSLYFFFQVLTAYVSNILTSLKFFTVPMIISGINSCIVIAAIILLHAQLDVLSVFAGGIAAYSFNLILLLLLLKKDTGWNFFSTGSPVEKRIWKNIFFTELGQLATVASSFFPLFLLSGFGKGVISLMNYGKNIADIPNTLVTAQLTGVLGIQLNEQAARGDRAGMNDSFISTGKLLIFILVPAGFFLFIFAAPIVELFYLRGNFDAAAVEGAAKFLRLLAITIFSVGVNAVVSRVFIASQAIRQAFIYQLVLNLLLIAAIRIFTDIYGAYGYPYAIILMNLVNYAGMYFVCKRFFSSINYGALLKYTAWVIAINGPVAALLYYVQFHTGIFNIYKLILGFCIYLIAFVIFSRINKMSGAAAKQGTSNDHSG